MSSVLHTPKHKHTHTDWSYALCGDDWKKVCAWGRLAQFPVFNRARNFLSRTTRAHTFFNFILCEGAHNTSRRSSEGGTVLNIPAAKFGEVRVNTLDHAAQKNTNFTTQQPVTCTGLSPNSTPNGYVCLIPRDRHHHHLVGAA
uniref:(northern house mosquito) hypothetical protein n=1 Tax=Culex pipiens TaxID=7175 RepID=A0A8D8BGW1_CULPI